MISTDRNSEIERQRLVIAINSHGAQESLSVSILPYDPNASPDADTSTQVIAPNYVDNSDFDFSKDGYLNNPLTGGDAAHECYNFYRQRFIKITDLVATAAGTGVSSASNPFSSSYTYPMDFVLLNGSSGGAALSGTLARVSDSTATLSAAAANNLTDGLMWIGETLAESSAKALKSSVHSLYAANEGTNARMPRWDKTNGWSEMGSDTQENFDLACPLPINLVRGGLRFYIRVYVSLRAGAATVSPIRLSAGVFDATTGQQRFIESSNLTLDYSVVGATGATTYKYKVIADLDDGTEIESDELTINTGNAVLSSTNYNRLTWTNATGILNFRIYREVGGVIKRVFTIRNGSRDFNDYGTDEGETPVSLPTASQRRPIAYAVSPEFNPAGENVWQWVTITLDIPQTYDTSLTTGKQWLRIGIEGECGDERMLLVDRVMFSTSNGGWQRSARDLALIANQNPSSLPTSTTQGFPNCFTLDTPVIVCESDGSNMREMSIGETDVGMYVFSGATRVHRIVKIKDSEAKSIINCTLSNGVKFRCSPSERFITSRADHKGTRIDNLTYGDSILCWTNGRVSSETIEEYVIIHKPETVRTLSLKGGHTFVAGGAIAHNNKDPNDIE
jgi:hypothetical protein